MAYLIGIDAGSTSCKAIACDHSGHFLATAKMPTLTHYRENGWAELDAEEMWNAVEGCIQSIVEKLGGDTCDGVAVASMGADVLLDEKGDQVHPIIAWFDSRSDKIANRWKETLGAEAVYQISGINPNYVAGITRMQWLKEEHPELFQKGRYWLQIQSFVSFKLTGKAKVSYTNACRTMAFDLNKRDWSEEILKTAGIDKSLLSEPVRSGDFIGAVTPEVEKRTGLKRGTPVYAGGIDYVCGAFASGIIDSGQMLDSTGTSEQLIVVTDRPQVDPRHMDQNFTSVAHVVNDKYYMMGMIVASGGILEWFKREFHCASFDELMEEAARQPIGSNGCMLLPYFAGKYTLGSDAAARGAFVGLTTATKRGDMVRALLEGLCYEMLGILEGMQKISGTKVRSIYAIGGAANSDFWLQMKADVTGVTIRSKHVPEAAALGAAMLAGLGAGVYESPADAVARVRHPEKVYTPDLERHKQYRKIYETLNKGLYPALAEFHKNIAKINLAQ